MGGGGGDGLFIFVAKKSFLDWYVLFVNYGILNGEEGVADID